MPSTVPGTELNRYRIIRLLGRGGMGEVYLARDETLQRQVAIKFLSLDATESAHASVLREARAVAALEHPNICGVYEVGDAPDGRPFIVMPYVEGETLAAVIARGPLTPDASLDLCAQVAGALAAAHQKGLVHRDLKPQNIIVSPSGSAKLLDFGLAKALPMTPFATDMSTQSTGTIDGAVKGTPAYMSPEQVLGQPVDARTDLFALGLVLYECLTGRRAFSGRGYELVGQILHTTPPPPSASCPVVSPELDALCARLLAKSPADRFPSAEALVSELRALSGVGAHSGSGVGTSGLATAAASSAQRRWGPVIASVLLACVLVALGATWAWRSWRTLPVPPPDAQRWYERGVEAVRQGAYHSGQLALAEAVRIAPSFALAHARLAEARSELDDERGAQESLLRVSSLVPDETWLPEDERLRLGGIRALVLRDVDASVAAYRTLAERRPSSTPGWIDLGRAQEASGHIGEAADSYRRAVEADRLAPVAHLRLASALVQESKRDEALAAFDEAARLYAASANVEGEAETVLRRGKARDAFGETAAARADVERALSLADTLRAAQLSVRARLALSSVTARAGQVADSIRLAGEAVKDALAEGLDTVAADGLIDLAGILQYDQMADASVQCERAVELAERRGARRTVARGRVQLAAIRNEQGRSEEALPLLEQAIAFLRSRRYRLNELDALSVAVRSHQSLGDYQKAKEMADDLLGVAETLRDEAQVAIASASLSSIASALGELPIALEHRVKAEAIRRAQNDALTLPYDLANHADLLIRLGRIREAGAPLAELEAGAARGLDSYKARRRRVAFLRGLAAIVERRFGDALGHLGPLAPFTNDSGQVAALGPLLLALAETRAGRTGPRSRQAVLDTAATDDPLLDGERCYWRGSTALARGDWHAALSESEGGLEAVGARANDELRWRLAAMGAIAAANAGRPDVVVDMRRVADAALDRIRTSWTSEAAAYLGRPDLAELLALYEQPRKGDAQ